MTPADLILAAEAKLRDAENNLASCTAALHDAKRLHGGVPNSEVLALAQVQAVIAQACANLAIAKAIVEAPEPESSDG